MKMKLAVVIPAYRVKDKIIDVVNSIGEEVANIIVVDDKCPEKSGEYLLKKIQDERMFVVFHEENKGVGGAMKTGFKKALELQVDVVVKLDGDGQMDASMIQDLIEPIVSGQADFTKGNRFYNHRYVRSMPKIRLFGNSVLSLINKCVTGYWSVMDPTNGFLAISSEMLEKIELEELSNRYFFESDLLYRLAIHSAVIVDFPMQAKYEDENSSLNIGKVIFSFIPKYINRFLKRIIYMYFVRDFNAGTIQLFFGLLLVLFGTIFGIKEWNLSIQQDIPATAGTIMIASLPIIIGFQMLLGFLMFDINNQPKRKK